MAGTGIERMGIGINVDVEALVNDLDFRMDCFNEIRQHYAIDQLSAIVLRQNIEDALADAEIGIYQIDSLADLRKSVVAENVANVRSFLQMVKRGAVKAPPAFLAKLTAKTSTLEPMTSTAIERERELRKNSRS